MRLYDRAVTNYSIFHHFLPELAEMAVSIGDLKAEERYLLMWREHEPENNLLLLARNAERRGDVSKALRYYDFYLALEHAPPADVSGNIEALRRTH